MIFHLVGVKPCLESRRQTRPMPLKETALMRITRIPDAKYA